MSKKKEQIAAAMAASKGIKLVESSKVPVSKNAGGLPPMPRAKRTKKKTPKDCECGCGQMTAGGRFCPGHDSILNGWVLRVQRSLIKLADIPHEGMRAAVKKRMKATEEPAAARPKIVKKPKVVAPVTEPDFDDDDMGEALDEFERDPEAE